MSERKEGWYWVVYDGMWEICLFKSGYWMHSGHDHDSSDGDFEQIGDYIPTPDEMKERAIIVANTYLNDSDEVAIQSFLVDFNNHPRPREFDFNGVNGYFQWWRKNRAAADGEKK